MIIVLILLTPLGLIAKGTAFGEWNVNEIENLVGYIPKGMIKGFDFSAAMKGYSIAGISGIGPYILTAFIGVLLIFIIFKLVLSKKRINNKD